VKERSELGAALLACLDDRPPEAVRAVLTRFDDDELAQLGLHAAHHRVVPYLAVAVRASGIQVTGEALSSLLRTHATRTASHLLVLADLEMVAETLSSADVPFLVVKGPVLAERYYPTPDLRTYNDLDVVVPPSAFERATEALLAAGSELLDRNWTLVRSETRGQLHAKLPLGSLIDVHWHLLNRRVVRADFGIATAELFERRRVVPVGTRPLPTLETTDTLLHLCLHASLSGGDRLIWLKDIERVISLEPPAWDEVVSRARSWGAARSVAISLARSRRTLGTPVPDEVLGSLTGSKLAQRLGAALDGWFPSEASVGKITPAVVWAQFARDSLPLTVRAMFSRTRRPIRGRSAPDAILRPSGTAADRREFLRSVSEEEPPVDEDAAQ
jgi:Uncharacterised nucleotidyltransferase